MVFVVRITRDGTGATSGVVERLRTGEKAGFRGLEALAGVIARMIASSRQDTGPDAPPRAE